MDLKKNTWMCVLLLALVIGTVSAVVCAQTNSASPPVQGAETDDWRKELREGREQIRELEKSVQELKTQNAGLTKQLEWLTPLGVLISVVLLAGTATSLIGAGTSLYSWNTDRKRLGEVYRASLDREKAVGERETTLYARQDELFSLSLKKDKESSERDGHIFLQSTETLTLVNQTLKLAKEASERASKALEKKLTKQHHDLEQDAKDLLDESKAYKNFKVLVENSSAKSNLQTLASDIEGLQNNLNMLDEEVSLLPHCSFIRGMNYHLDQHVKQAIQYWKQVKNHPASTDSLSVMALYWIGYEQNNKGDFENAASNFELASTMAKGAQAFELQRIKIESKFFDTERFLPEQVLPELEALYKKIKLEDESDEVQKVRSAIAGTLGNIYYQLANETKDSDQSNQYYLTAKQIFAEAPSKNKWNWFGYGECCFKLKDYAEAEDCLLNKVKPEAEFEYSTRSEPRTKVLGQTTVLICSLRVRSLHENVTSLYNLIKTTLGTVDTEVTVYSPFQRRNVFKHVFVEDLENAMKEFERSSAPQT